MGMPSIQELFGNLEKHEMELKRFLRNDEDRGKKTLTLKAITNFDKDEKDLENLKDLYEDDDLALLSKKYQKLLRAKKGANRRRPLFPKKNTNKGD